jgi:hypothetical protein
VRVFLRLMEVGAIVFGAIGIFAFAMGASGMVVIPLLIVPVGAMLFMTLTGRA